jgi:hypothetical protein
MTDDPFATQTTVEPEPTKEVARVEKTPIPMGPQGVQLQTLEDLFRFAKMISQTDFCPKALKVYKDGAFDVEATGMRVAAAMQYGLEVGFSAMQALWSVDVINGKPSLGGDASMALLLSRGILEDYEIVESGTWPDDDYTVTVAGTRKGMKTPTIGAFSVHDAKVANLWGKRGPWTEYPRRMVKYRAIGFFTRDIAPDAMKGLITKEEAYDYPKREVREAEATVKDIFDPSQEAPEAPQKPAEAPKVPEVVEEPETTPEAQQDMTGAYAFDEPKPESPKADLGPYYEDIKAYVEALTKCGKDPKIDLAPVSLMDAKDQEVLLRDLTKYYEEVMNEQGS